MSTLHKAYQVLGLEPGTSLEAVKRRYKRLVMVWHPDRMQNDAGRREAEEELKRINGAYDNLKNHFEKHHTAGASCACQPSAAPGSHTRYQGANSTGATSGNGAADRQRKAQEQEARQRHEERRRKAEEESRRAAGEAARKAEEQRRAADASKRAAEEALKQTQALKEGNLRWKVAMAAGAAVVLLLGVAFLGVAARNLVSDIQRQWSNQSQQTGSIPNLQPPPPVISGNPSPTDDPDNPYIPLEYRFPGGNPTSWRKFMNEEERKQQQREDEQRKQDIYFARLAIDRNQKIIDHCTNTIAQLEAKIADPYVSEFEKNKLRDYQRSDTPLSVEGRYLKRVGRTNQIMSPEELRQRLLDSGSSSWDSKIEESATIADLDKRAIKQFVSAMKKRGRRAIPDDEETTRTLAKLRLLEHDKPTRAAILLLGKDPKRFYPAAFIKAGRFKSLTMIVDDKEFGGTLFQQLDQVML